MNLIWIHCKQFNKIENTQKITRTHGCYYFIMNFIWLPNFSREYCNIFLWMEIEMGQLVWSKIAYYLRIFEVILGIFRFRAIALSRISDPTLIQEEVRVLQSFPNVWLTSPRRTLGHSKWVKTDGSTFPRQKFLKRPQRSENQR